MSDHHKLINTLLAIEWIVLITVMFGGESLLRLSQGSISEHTERYFRAGHAHAGIFTAIGMVLILVLPRTDLSGRAMVLTWLAWVASVLIMAGGLFVHAYTGDPGKGSFGTFMTAAGGVVMGVVSVWMAIALLQAR